jgi:DNA-binding NarL/FixJ family response regulator
MTSLIRVLLVDDHPIIRNGLRASLQSQPDFAVVGEAGTCTSAIAQTSEQKPDVLVLDLNLPDGSGWDVLEQLRQRGILPPTLILSTYDEQQYARRLLRSGARGYLMKEEPMDNIIAAIRRIHQGGFAASQKITDSLMSTAAGEPNAESGDTVSTTELSDRELQIFTMIGEGLRNKDIAPRIGVSEKTVATYKARLMVKLGINSTKDLLEHFRKSSAQ